MNYDELSELMKSKLSEGGMDAALAFIESHINENPNNPDAYIVRGELCAHSGDFAKALDDAGRAIKINPKNATAYLTRGIT